MKENNAISSTRNDSKDIKKRQVSMHRDYFIRAENAVDNRFYFEAIFLEYAAIEGRLEVILGVLGFPCNKTLDNGKRRKVHISDRIECIRAYRNAYPAVFSKSKLPESFFMETGALKKWIGKRNTFVHGLLKNADEYTNRKNNSYTVAKQGLEYSKMLYREAKRIRNLTKNHPELLAKATASCQNNYCIVIKKDQKTQEAHHA